MSIQFPSHEQQHWFKHLLLEHGKAFDPLPKVIALAYRHNCVLTVNGDETPESNMILTPDLFQSLTDFSKFAFIIYKYDGQVKLAGMFIFDEHSKEWRVHT